MVPKVDTFAKDISEEIKSKEASLTDIATASNDIGNSAEEASPLENSSSRIFLVAIGFLVIGILALIAFIYYYLTVLGAPKDPTPPQQDQTSSIKASTLSSLSSTLYDNIGRHISLVEKKDKGYVLTISSYAPVFAYVTRRESDYIIQLLDTAGKDTGEKIKTESTPAPITISTSTGTSSAVTISTGTQLRENEVAISGENLISSNVTLSNVNIRIFTKGSVVLAYSFISTEKLVIAATAEDVLAIRNAILR